MAEWHPDAIRQPLGGGTYTGGAPKIVWHTTEGANYPGPSIYHGTNPHFTCDFKKRKLYQHTPISQAARALLHPAGTGDTNNDNCVQVELVDFAARSGEWSAGDYAYIRDLSKWIEKNHGVPSKAIEPWTHSRLAWSSWHGFSGHLGHMHVPANDHVDPGTAFKVNLIVGKQPSPAYIVYLKGRLKLRLGQLGAVQKREKYLRGRIADLRKKLRKRGVTA